MTAALDAYKAAMATARAVFDAPQTADDYRAVAIAHVHAAYTAAYTAAYDAYDAAYDAADAAYDATATDAADAAEGQA